MKLKENMILELIIKNHNFNDLIFALIFFKIFHYKILNMKLKSIFIFIVFTCCIFFIFESCEKEDEGVMIIPSPPSQPSNS